MLKAIFQTPAEDVHTIRSRRATVQEADTSTSMTQFSIEFKTQKAVQAFTKSFPEQWGKYVKYYAIYDHNQYLDVYVTNENGRDFSKILKVAFQSAAWKEDAWVPTVEARLLTKI